MPSLKAEDHATEVLLILNNPTKSASFKLKYKTGEDYEKIKELFNYSNQTIQVNQMIYQNLNFRLKMQFLSWKLKR